MKIDFIKTTIKQKLEKFFDSIEDANIRELVKKNIIVAGGALVSPIMGREINDYDCYLRDTLEAVVIAEYFVEQFSKIAGCDKYPVVTQDTLHKINKEALPEGDKTYGKEFSLEEGQIKIFIQSTGISKAEETPIGEYFEALGKKGETQKQWKKRGHYIPVLLTDNAISFTDDIQLIIRFTGEPKEIMKNFDFAHTHVYYDYWNNKIEYTKDALQSLATMELKFTGSKYPLCSLFRIRKFLTRGFNIGAGEIMRIAFRLQEFDLYDINVLRDQLIGVDYVYMQNYIEKITADSQTLDYTYLSRIIDEIFPV